MTTDRNKTITTSLGAVFVISWVAFLVFLAVSITKYLDIRQAEAENGRYIPHDVRWGNYGDGSHWVESRGLRMYFDTRTGRQFYWSGQPTEEEQNKFKSE